MNNPRPGWKGGKRPRIGLVLDWVGTLYHEELINGVASYCGEAGMDLCVVPVGRFGSLLNREFMRNILVGLDYPSFLDGAIVTSAALGNIEGSEAVDAFLEGLGALPFVSIGAAHEGRPAVIPDNSRGIRAMMRHLAGEHGFRRIAFVAGPENNTDARERFIAYLAALKEEGIPYDPSLVHRGDFTRDTGAAAAVRIMGPELARTDAVFFANDTMAMGFMDSCRERGIAWEGRLPIAGFDDAETSAPAGLTTVRLSIYDLAREAARKLRSVLAGGEEGHDRFPLEIVVRRSCGCGANDAPPLRARRRPAPPADALVAGNQGLATTQDPAGSLEVSQIAKAAMAAAFARCGAALPEASLGTLSSLLSPAHDDGAFRAASRALLARPHPGFPALHSALLAARDALASAGAGRSILARVEDAYLSCEEEQGQRENSNLLALYYGLNSLEEGSEALTASLEREKLLDALDQLLGTMGTKECYVALFEDPEEPLGECRLVFAHRGRRLALPKRGLRYPAKEFLPARFLAGPGRRNILGLSLFKGREQIGLAFFSFEPGRLELLEVLRSKLSIALKASALFEQIASRAASLEEEVDARVAEIARSKTRLEVEVAERRRAQKRLRGLLKQLEASNRSLTELSLHDELTGLLNRRGFLEFSAQAGRTAARTGKPFLLVFADMDGLKKINDSHGHLEGDRAIRDMAAILSRSFRECDNVARMGGDEFAILMLDADLGDADAVRARIEAGCAAASEGRPYRVGISMGFEEFHFGKGQTLAAVIARADMQLYEMKAARKRGGG